MEHDIALLSAGVIVGIMNAIAGGGMLIGFPVLVALGLPPIVANVTGAVVTTPGQLSSAYGYRRYLRRVPKRFLWLALPCVVGATGGSLLLRNTSAAHFEQLVPLLVLFGVGLFALQPYLHFHTHRHLATSPQSGLPLWVIGLAIVPICFYGSYFGPGYGFLMLAFLGFTNLEDAHAINALKNISAILVSGTAIICLYSTYLIDWRAGILMGSGSLVGGYLGARGAQKVSSHWLRVIIICIGVAAAVYLGVREY